MKNKHYACKGYKIIIEGIEFNTNWYRIIKKDNKLYLEINNEVLTKEQYNCLLKMLRHYYYFGDNLFYIRLNHTLVSEDGNKTNKVLMCACKIPDGEVIKVLNGKTSNLMFKFEIISTK